MVATNVRLELLWSRRTSILTLQLCAGILRCCWLRAFICTKLNSIGKRHNSLRTWMMAPEILWYSFMSLALCSRQSYHSKSLKSILTRTKRSTRPISECWCCTSSGKSWHLKSKSRKTVCLGQSRLMTYKTLMWYIKYRLSSLNKRSTRYLNRNTNCGRFQH
jgi:hypothetical protein